MRLRQEVTECSGNGHGERANGHKRAESGKRRATDSTGMSALRHHSTLEASMLPPFCRPGHNQKAVRHRAAVIGRCCVPKLAPCTSRANFRSEEHTSELQSLMRNSYAVFCLNTKKQQQPQQHT